MKDFLSNEHYCYKIHTLLMKTNASSLSFNSQPPYMEYLAPLPPPQFYKENLISSSMIFQKSNKVGLCAL